MDLAENADAITPKGRSLGILPSVSLLKSTVVEGSEKGEEGEKMTYIRPVNVKTRDCDPLRRSARARRRKISRMNMKQSQSRAQKAGARRSPISELENGIFPYPRRRSPGAVTQHDDRIFQRRFIRFLFSNASARAFARLRSRGKLGKFAASSTKRRLCRRAGAVFAGLKLRR